MQDIFVLSQWDTLWAFLQHGRPPLWVLLAIVNGGFLILWIATRLVKDRPLRPATVHFRRAMFILLNIAVVFRDDTLNLLRPLLRHFI